MQEQATDPSPPESPVNIVLDQVYGMWTGFLEHLPQIGITVVVLLFTWLLAWALGSLTEKLLARANRRRSIRVLARKLATIGIWVFGIITAAAVLFPSVTPGKLLTVLGLGGVAVGFAFKDVFENFLAGILILTREPFELGDFIETDDYEGWVDEITIRDTRLRKTDGQTIIMPNSELFKNPVVVRTARKLRRLSLACGVGYGEDVGESREIIRKAVENLGIAEGDKPVEVFATAFGASSIDFEVRWWTGSEPRDHKEATDKAIEAIKSALDEAGIEIPFPYRTLTFAESLELRRMEPRETEEAAA